MNKEYKSLIKEIDKVLPINGEKKTFQDYKLAIEEVDILLQKLEEKSKIEYDNEKTCI
ncbi:MAG: hypothetical protein JSW06_00890 [Thermoplasmatales archaeon]|nr:MAG: hypothetical protein JSW06_00890 [Thermoplasmatales archaeon]